MPSFPRGEGRARAVSRSLPAFLPSCLTGLSHKGGRRQPRRGLAVSLNPQDQTILRTIPPSSFSFTLHNNLTLPLSNRNHRKSHNTNKEPSLHWQQSFVYLLALKAIEMHISKRFVELSLISILSKHQQAPQPLLPIPRTHVSTCHHDHHILRTNHWSFTIQISLLACVDMVLQIHF